MSLFEAKDITKFFGEKKVLDKINFNLVENEIVCILGPSGAGKSTLLRCLAGLENFDFGCLYLDEKKILDAQEKIKNNLKELHDMIGFVFQDFNLFPHFDVYKNICDAAIKIKKFDKRKVYEQADLLLKKFGLADKKNFYVHELSGGQKQRVAIARSLILNPEVIFFDEPTSALDNELKKEIVMILKDILREKKIKSMLIVTHEIEFAREIADKIIFMDAGKIIEEGADIINNPKSERMRLFLKKIN